MKQYTIGKKAAVIVLHQLCMILMVTGVFATGYAFRHDAHGNIDIYTLISLAGLVGSFVSLAYMANVAGRKSEDDYTIYYLPIDKVYSRCDASDIYTAHGIYGKSDFRRKKPAF